MRNTKKNNIQLCAYRSGRPSLGSKKRGIFIKTSQKNLLIWLKFTSNEIMQITKKHTIQMCTCQPGTSIRGLKNRAFSLKALKNIS